MKTNVLLTALTLVSSSLIAADSDEVLAAVKKLAEQPNYAWKTTVAVPEGGGGRFRPGPQEGKAEKDGLVHVTMTFGENTSQYFVKGEKAAFTNRDGEWQNLSDVDEEEGPGRFIGRMVRNIKSATAQAEDLIDDSKDLKKEGDAYSGALTEDGAKALARFGRRGGDAQGPTITNAKGAVKFWVKDGMLSKYEYKVSGTMTFDGNDRPIDRTTTVEIKDIGKTKIEVPAEAKRKLG